MNTFVTEVTENAVFIGARTFIEPQKITHMKADINYTIVYYNTGVVKVLSYTMKLVLKHLEEHEEFVRLSRAEVVNMRYVKKQSPEKFELINGKKVFLSRRRKKLLFG